MSNLTACQITLVEAVKAHASDNYEKGWDVIVECYDDESIAELIGSVRGEELAIARVAEFVEAREEYRKDILGWGGLDEHGNEIQPEVEEAPAPVATVSVPVEEEKSVEQLTSEEQYPFPLHTVTGVVCGRCTKNERERMGDRKVQLRHATAGHARLCYEAAAQMAADAKAEYEMERSAERYWEERGADDGFEQWEAQRLAGF